MQKQQHRSESEDDDPELPSSPPQDKLHARMIRPHRSPPNTTLSIGTVEHHEHYVKKQTRAVRWIALLLARSNTTRSSSLPLAPDNALSTLMDSDATAGAVGCVFSQVRRG
ncbi:MAG TPA: hypothetical protein VEM39_05735, partial [Myxococcaceae bacterium]|nr:hypothetical protein [Myxococcaceae bacterium]